MLSSGVLAEQAQDRDLVESSLLGGRRTTVERRVIKPLQMARSFILLE